VTAYRFTPQADGDLFDVWSFIASDNPAAADRVESAIYEACALLADGPTRGHTRKDLTARPLRFWTVQRFPNYIVVYDPATSPLQIIRILHGKRDLKRVFDEP
jgi:antitoxin ParD1/3/4